MAGGARRARGLVGGAAGIAAFVLLGAATAIPLRGTEGPDRLRGTARGDTLEGLGGNDDLRGLGGPDLIDGGGGRDTIRGGAGPDAIIGEGDAARDVVSCGSGADLVTAGLGDAVAADCETVVRELSHDALSTIGFQHQTQAEPDSFAYGSTMVAAYQVARAEGSGGAAAIGFSTSRDAGRSWRSGLLPRLTSTTGVPGPYERASDPSVAYDARHALWLVASLVITDDGRGVVVSRSSDGVAWRAPVTAAPGVGESPDKNWIVCDNWNVSPRRGTCYLAYYDVRAAIVVRSTRDGGQTWSPAIATPVRALESAIVNGALPVVRPDGGLTVLYSVFGADQADVDEIGAVRSADGGATFAPPVRVAPLANEDVIGLRLPPFVSAEVAGDGRIWAAWADCRFAPACDVNDTVVTSSRDGVVWTTPIRVPAVPSSLGLPLSHVMPGLGVDPASAGARTRLGVVHYSVPPYPGCFYVCVAAQAYFTGSSDAGKTWTRPVRLNPRPMRLDWMATTEIGWFLGDYVSTSWIGGRPIPVFTLARRPVVGELRQGIVVAPRLPSFPARTAPRSLR